MSNKRKLFRNGDKLSQRLLSTSSDTEGYRLLSVEMQERSKAHEKPKEAVEVVEVKEVSDNNDFQKQVISMLNQILEKQNELEKVINQINLKLNERGAKLDTVIEQSAKSQGMESTIKSRPIENLKKLEFEIELIKNFLRSSQS